MLDYNAQIQSQTTVTTDGHSDWFTTENNRVFIGAPSIGINIGVYINDVTGNPNTLFSIEYTNDGGTTVFTGEPDPLGSIDSAGVRFIRASNRYPQLRLKWEMGVANPGTSSSSSSSSSSVGSSSISFSAWVTPTQSV